MNKNIVYIVIAILLAGVVGYLVWDKSGQYDPSEEQNFVTKDIDGIERIYLADKHGNTIKLDKIDDYWMVNDTYKAMSAKVDLLLNTFKSLVVYSPVAESAMGNAVKELAVQGIKVEIYHKAGRKPSKVYFVGKPDQGQNANYMLMQIDGKSAKQPYLVHIPGFVGDLQTRFLVLEKDWRDLTIFDYKLDEIKEVSTTYHDVLGASFVLSVEGKDNYTIQHPGFDAPAPQEQLFKTGITKYLDSFGNLNAEAEANDFAFKDSVINGPKFATIKVTATDGKQSDLILYRMPVNRRTKTIYDPQGNAVKVDPDYYYALYNDGKDFALAQHFVLGKILRSYNDFLLKPTNNPAGL